MFTDAVEESESEEDVTDSLLGEIGDRLRPRSSCDDECFPLIILAIARTGGRVELILLVLLVLLLLSSSWEVERGMEEDEVDESGRRPRVEE